MWQACGGKCSRQRDLFVGLMLALNLGSALISSVSRATSNKKQAFVLKRE
jgi:hypothetical protein